MTFEEVEKLIEGFEDGSLSKEKWTHEAHFIMALWYCFKLPIPAAVEAICKGIKAYNIAVGGKNTSEYGYHETITLTYIQLVACFLIRERKDRSFEQMVSLLLSQSFLDKDYLLRFYSRETLMSVKARTLYVAPVSCTTLDLS